LTALALLLAAGPPLPAAELIPVQVRDGRCECVLPTADPNDKYFLIVGSLSPSAGHYPVCLETGPADGPASLPRERPADDPAWKRRVAALAERLRRARQRGLHAGPFPPPASPPREKTFYVFVGDREFHNPRCYAAVPAELRHLGRHCQVYVDRTRAEDDVLRATVADVVRTFDEEIHPRARELLGEALDVDRDGRFTILLTGRLARVQEGKVALDGFVRGSDFYRDLEAPFGNRCDMMYLSADLRSGPYLRTLLAHEFTHAVVFSEHVFGGFPGSAAGRDEESWLNEGLAHLMEDAHGYTWANLDYRVSAFLSDPARYRLVVPDYYGGGVWRDPGTRGAAYLFLRWCADHCGSELLRRLTQSGLYGVENLEVATQKPFADLFRAWSAAVLLTGSGLEAIEVSPLRSDLRRPLGGRLLCGPRFREVALASDRQQFELTGTAAAYALLHTPGSPRSRLTVSASPQARLQVTLLRLPREYPRLRVSCEAAGERSAVRLRLTAHGGDATVTGIAWERLVPEGKPRDTSYRPEVDARQAVQAWLGDPLLRRGQARTSRDLRLPGLRGDGGGYVIKVVCTDEAGRRVAGWAALPPAARGSPP
jgi:hypothetical protein